jgi:hypothetical protein
VKYRVVTTDYADDGTPIVDHHEAVDTFADARLDAEQLKDQHADVSVYRYSDGVPDLLWSSRANSADS